VNVVTLFKSNVTVIEIRYYTFESQFKTTFMPILTVLLILIAAGVLLWLVNTYIPMDRKIKSILNIVVVVIVIVWLLRVFGLLHYFNNIHI